MARSEYETLRPWLLKIAWSMTIPSNIEDLAQEGWVAAWEAERKYEPQFGTTLIGWIKHCAYQKMLSKVRTTKFKENLIPTEDEFLISALTVDLPEVECSYHRGEILKALNALTPRQREYVALRFWGGYSYSELTQYLGYEPTGLWNRPRSGARDKLRESLKHLSV